MEITYKGPKNPMFQSLIKMIMSSFVLLALAVAALTVAFGSWVTVNAGHRGVVVRMGAVQKGVLGEGLHFKLPWIDKVREMNVQVQKNAAHANAASKDMQIVSTNIATNYMLVPETVDEVYQKIGLAFEDKIIEPAVQETVKAVTARYNAEELITKRHEVKDAIKADLTQRLATYNIRVVDISITNFDFGQEYNKAIEAKQVAEQQVAKAKNELERIKVEAQQKVTQAKAEADALKLQRQEITKELLELRKIENERIAIEKWNGNLPQVTSGAVPFVNVDKMR